MMAGWTLLFISGAETAPCPGGTVDIYVTEADDLPRLSDVLNCTGGGVFNISWLSSLYIPQVIEVSSSKVVTVTGSGFPTIIGVLNDDVDAVDVDIDSGSTSGMFSVSDGSTLSLNDIVMDGGQSEEGGAIAVLSSSSVWISGCTFMNNNASTGGAIYAASNSSIYVNGDTLFTDNSAAVNGGAIFATESHIHIDGNVTFQRNSAGFNGGAVIANESTLYIDGVTYFAHNSAQEHGGGVFVSTSSAYIYGCTDFSNNTADRFGGGFHAYKSDAVFDGSTSFSHNWVNNSGGAMHSFTSEILIYGHSSFFHNSADSSGGAIDGSTSIIHIHGFTDFRHNSAGIFGGAFYADNYTDVYINGSSYFAYNTACDGGAIAGSYCDFSISGSKNDTGDKPDYGGASPCFDFNIDPKYVGSATFIENTADSQGGAMYTVGADLLLFSGARFESNEAEFGGAIYVASTGDEQTEFTDCNFHGNEATDGGAVYLYTGTGQDVFTTATFNGNSAKYSGGAMFHTGSLWLVNATFEGNMAGAEGPAIISIGLLEGVSNVTFTKNSYHCSAGEYGVINQDNKDEFCDICFDEVCSRCSTSIGDEYYAEQISIDGFPTCEEPPTGAVASTSGTTVSSLSLEQGYYRTSKRSRVVVQCYQEEACPAGNNVAEVCTPGYKGPYCAICNEGYAPGVAYSCHECSGVGSRWALGFTIFLSLVMLVMARLFFSHLRSVAHEGTEEGADVARGFWRQKYWYCQTFLVKMLPLTAIKIVITVWQIISQFVVIAGDVYPEEYTSFVSKLSPTNLDIGFILSYSCIMTTDFYDRLLFATISPPLALLVLLASYMHVKKRFCISELGIRVVRHKHQTAALFVVFFVYSSVSNTIFQTFVCDKLDDGVNYLRADYSLTCTTSLHSAFKVYAMVMVVIYPVGIPTVFAWWLARNRRDLVRADRDTLVHLAPMKGIWNAYKPSRYFYEVIECGRRIILTGIAAFVPTTNTAQIPAVLMVSVVFVFTSETVSPFAKRVDMGLYRWGNCIVVASLYVAFLQTIEIDLDATLSLSQFSRVLIAANAIALLAVVIQTVLLVRTWHGGVKEKVVMVDTPVRRSMSASFGGSDPLHRESKDDERDGDAIGGAGMANRGWVR